MDVPPPDPRGLGEGGRLSTRLVHRARDAGGRGGRIGALLLLAFVQPCPAAHVLARIDGTFPAWALREDLEIVGRKGPLTWIVGEAASVVSLREAGFSIEVEVADLEAAGARGPGWGIFHTLSEVEAFLDSLHRAFPALASAPFPLGVTHEGRVIWALKISDNPSLDEDEPRVLIDGLHHAREVMSTETILDFARLLCTRYESDPQVRAVVDQREVFLVPVVNPDGMAYNEQTNPAGGGMWRKNRRNNGDGTFGVDLNRNYPFEWGRDDGSSPLPSSPTYRGPSPASEPETQALMGLMSARRFATHLSMHSFLGATLIPWGYTSAPTPDDTLLRAWARRLSWFNDYVVAQPPEVLYPCSGMTTDYAYGETILKNRMISATIEIGGLGFWPADSEVPGLLEECRWPLLYAARSAGVWLSLAGWTIDDPGDGRVDPGETVALWLAVENQSVCDEASVALLRVLTDDPYVQLQTATAPAPALAPMDTAPALLPIVLTVDPTTPQGHSVVLRVRLTADGFTGEDRLTLVVGRPPALFFDDFEEGLSRWVCEGGWGLTEEASHSPVTSLTDSPGGSYGNYANSSARVSQPLDLSGVEAQRLSFWHRYETEPSYDHCVVEASGDGGATWRQLGPQYSGSSRGWRSVELALDEFAGAPAFLLRFRLETDVSITGDGWYLDDVMISAPPGNLPPPAPVPLAPPDGATTENPTLLVHVGQDPDGDVLTCGFFVYADSLLTALVATSDGIPVVEGTASWAPEVPGDGVFWWRAFAFDGTVRGPLSPPWRVGVGLRAWGRGDGAASLRVSPIPSFGPTTLHVWLPSTARATLSIHDVAGRLVATPLRDHLSAGDHRVVWDGSDSLGRSVAPGTYVARLSLQGSAVTHRLVLLRQ